jgi:hypothetical protein
VKEVAVYAEPALLGKGQTGVIRFPHLRGQVFRALLVQKCQQRLLQRQSNTPAARLLFGD